jgi:monofunctional biosynthetic peptidoglycan transglycosylase
VADNDTRYDLEARGDPLAPTDALRSDSAPAPRIPDLAPDLNPNLTDEPDTTRPPRQKEHPADPPIAVPETGPTREQAPSADEPWHAVIAAALSLREIAEGKDPDAHSLKQEATQPITEPVAENSATLPPDQSAPPSETARAEASTPSNAENEASFTDAVEGLFRPPTTGPGEETHLVTLGRRLDPSLRIPRPVAPVIEPKAEPEHSAENVWKTRLYTFARYTGLGIAAYLALVLVLIVLFRFVNPPGSMLMLTQLLTGTSIDRTWASFENISPALVRAVIVSEDGRFCEHSGIDTQAMKEAIDRASGGAPRGASTISMQVIKNLFLWNAKSYVRKVIEIPLTLIMELLWPKKRVLEVYLNIAEWGPGVFGAEAAARHHFNKSAARLDEREAALLAAVLPNPIARDAGAPNSQTSRKARVIQSRVKAYGAVASCLVAPAPQRPPAAAKSQNIRKPQPLRTQPRKKKVDDWSPILNFGN